MKKKYLIYLFLILGCTNNPQRKQNYRLSSDTIDFINLPYRDTLNKIIYLQNESDSLLYVKKIETECGCTAVQIKDSLVKPGDSTPIQIRYVPSAANDTGNIMKFITFRVNSVPTFVNVTIKGKILR
ncbi:DUF1573 domain-containing protein [Ferruginibacter sp.]